MNQKLAELSKKANHLPEIPGVYTMYNAQKKVIYVGKAVNLKNRVSSYFRGSHNAKTTALVENIDNFEVIVTNTELDALLTECSLIRLHRPFYNILLKTGRGYPYILVGIDNGWPFVELENDRSKKGRFFGPFANRETAKNLVELIKKTFLLPRCRYKSRKPDKICLEYHISHCRGYCEKKVSEEETANIVENICAVLNGDIDEIYEQTEQAMIKAADKLEFEYAVLFRNRLFSLDLIRKRQRPMVAQNRNADYIAYSDRRKENEEESLCSIFMLRIRNGYVVGERSDIFDEPFSDELLYNYITRFYSEDSLATNKIYIDSEYEWLPLVNEWLKNKVKLPTLTQDSELLELTRKNAVERLLQFEGKTEKAQRTLAAFCEFAELDDAGRIEIYDNSSIASTDVVCGMVVCVEGLLAKKDYKKFKIEKTMGNDDTAYMKEALFRRLKRAYDGDESFLPLPKLIICDGALGQIHAVETAVKSFNYDIPVMGLKKDSKHRTKSLVFSNGKEKPLLANKDVFVFCGKLQDEAHRFAISYHKTLRDKLSQQSELQNIEGIGKAKARALFLKFKSIDKIKSASTEELLEVKGINEKLVDEIRAYFGNSFA